MGRVRQKSLEGEYIIAEYSDQKELFFNFSASTKKKIIIFECLPLDVCRIAIFSSKIFYSFFVRSFFVFICLCFIYVVFFLTFLVYMSS